MCIFVKISVFQPLTYARWHKSQAQFMFYPCMQYVVSFCYFAFILFMFFPNAVLMLLLYMIPPLIYTITNIHIQQPVVFHAVNSPQKDQNSHK